MCRGSLGIRGICTSHQDPTCGATWCKPPHLGLLEMAAHRAEALIPFLHTLEQVLIQFSGSLIPRTHVALPFWGRTLSCRASMR